MTHKEWDAAWLDAFNRYRTAGRSVDTARRAAFTEMQAKHGARPEDPHDPSPKVPFWQRMVLSLVVHKLQGLMEGNPMGQRILTSVVFGLGAAYAVIQASGFPADVNGWVSVAGAFVVGFWGKFSSSRTIVAANYKAPEPPK